MKFVFILGSTGNPNSIKRIDEFIEHGYVVEAYSFKRDEDIHNKPRGCEITIIGTFSNSTRYIQRCKTIYNGVKGVVDRHKAEQCIYYLVGMEVALFLRLISKAPYIFEEADIIHANFHNKIKRKVFECIDKYIISHSCISTFRSEGFLLYHFGEKVPNNVMVIPNRLNPYILNFPIVQKREPDLNRLRVGYVGVIRHKSALNFCKVYCNTFPEYEFHFYGVFSSAGNKLAFAELEQYANCYFHGAFISPNDLPTIYANLDLVFSAYDVDLENVRYAEPNKLYEAMYFETPIIVSSGTFLSRKVDQLGIGFDIDPMNDEEVKSFISSLSADKLQCAKNKMKQINKHDLLSINDKLFQKIEDSVADRVAPNMNRNRF